MGDSGGKFNSDSNTVILKGSLDSGNTNSISSNQKTVTLTLGKNHLLWKLNVEELGLLVVVVLIGIFLGRMMSSTSKRRGITREL